MRLEVHTKGSTDSTEKWLASLASGEIFQALDRYGRQGVEALRAATPVDSTNTANCWEYEIVRDGKSYSIIWNNTNVQDGRPIAILLQYGHATRTGGYVEGRDYINPALKPIFDQMANEAWKAVTRK
jgi:hypothetical protein